MICEKAAPKVFNASLGVRVLIVLTIELIPHSLNSRLLHCDACRKAMSSKHDPSWPKGEDAKETPSVLSACEALVLKSPTLLDSGRVRLPSSDVGPRLRTRLRVVRDAFTQRGCKALDDLLMLLNRDDRSQSLLLLPADQEQTSA